MQLILVVTSLIALGCSLSSVAHAKPDGAPFESCILLTPKHGQQPSQPINTNPFKIVAEKTLDSKAEKEAVHVSIEGGETKFAGFIVQARYANNPTMLVDGRFEPEDAANSKVYTCKPGEKIINNNTWTHSENSDKSHVTAIWMAPKDFKEDIIFTATIVKDKKTFWEGVNSSKVMINNEATANIPMEGRSSVAEAHKMQTGANDKMSDDYKQSMNNDATGNSQQMDGGSVDNYSNSNNNNGESAGYGGNANTSGLSMIVAMIASFVLLQMFH